MTATTLRRRRKPKVTILEPGFSERDLARVLRAFQSVGMPVARVVVDGPQRRMTVVPKAGKAVDTSEYMTIREACVYARIGRTRAYELISTGALRTTKLGASTVVLKRSVDKLMRQLPRKKG